MAHSVSYSLPKHAYGDNVIENKWKWNYMMAELNGSFFSSFADFFFVCSLFFAISLMNINEEIKKAD